MARLRTAEQLRLRRELRTEIARHRRQINASVNGLKREGRQLVSWRTHVARHPLAALAGAFGIGMALSSGLPRRGWLRWLTGLTINAMFSNVPSKLFDEAFAAFTGAVSASRKT